MGIINVKKVYASQISKLFFSTVSFRSVIKAGFDLYSKSPQWRVERSRTSKILYPLLIWKKGHTPKRRILQHCSSHEDSWLMLPFYASVLVSIFNFSPRSPPPPAQLKHRDLAIFTYILHCQVWEKNGHIPRCEEETEEEWVKEPW